MGEVRADVENVHIGATIELGIFHKIQIIVSRVI